MHQSLLWGLLLFISLRLNCHYNFHWMFSFTLDLILHLNPRQNIFIGPAHDIHSFHFVHMHQILSQLKLIDSNVWAGYSWIKHQTSKTDAGNTVYGMWLPSFCSFRRSTSHASLSNSDEWQKTHAAKISIKYTLQVQIIMSSFLPDRKTTLKWCFHYSCHSSSLHTLTPSSLSSFTSPD